MAGYKRFGFYLLVLAVASELLLPFVLGHFIPGYQQKNMLISSFGETGMETRNAFRIWEIFNGVLFIAAAPAFYQEFKTTSPLLAAGLVGSLILFGLGDCIITGLFARAKTAEEVGFASILHNVASGAGFIALFVGNGLLIWLFFLRHKPGWGLVLLTLLVLAGITMLLFSSPKLPLLKAYHVAHRGLWQRLTLLFLYLPYLLVSLRSLQHK